MIFCTKNSDLKKNNHDEWVILLSTITATKVIKSDHLKYNFMVDACRNDKGNVFLNIFQYENSF